MLVAFQGVEGVAEATDTDEFQRSSREPHNEVDFPNVSMDVVCNSLAKLRRMSNWLESISGAYPLRYIGEHGDELPEVFDVENRVEDLPLLAVLFPWQTDAFAKNDLVYYQSDTRPPGNDAYLVSTSGREKRSAPPNVMVQRPTRRMRPALQTSLL